MGTRTDHDDGIFRAFGHRDFAVLWCGALVSNVGTWLQALAIPFVLFQITGSAFWVGLAAVAQFVPYFLFSPLGGWLADHVTRRTVLLSTQVGMAAAAILLWATWVAGSHQPLMLLIFLAVGGTLSGINLPSWQAFTSDLVPREDLHSAITLNSVMFNAARAIGPGLAGLILALLGPSWAFGLNALSFLFVIVALVAVRTRGRPDGHVASRGVLREFAEAVEYVGTQVNLMVVILVTLIVALFANPVFAFTVVFAADVYYVGPLPLGILNAMLGVGAIIAAPFVAGWPRRLPLSTIVLAGLVVLGAGLLTLGLAASYIVGLVALTCIGGCFLAVTSGVNTSLQLQVASPFRGRVMAFRMMVFTLATAVGSFIQGVCAERFGAQVTMATAGLAILIATAMLMWAPGRLRLATLDPIGQSSVEVVTG